MNPPNPMSPTPRSNVTASVSNQWTPGPWRIDNPNRPDRGTEWRDIVSDHAEFAPCYVGEACGPDARLIALAPEMAEALADAADELETVCKRVDFEVESAGGSEMLAAWLSGGKKTLATARAILARLNGEGGGV